MVEHYICNVVMAVRFCLGPQTINFGTGRSEEACPAPSFALVLGSAVRIRSGPPNSFNFVIKVIHRDAFLFFVFDYN